MPMQIKSWKRILVVLFGVGLVLSITGCGTPGERAEKHYKRGNLFLQAEKFAESIDEFKKCIELDPSRSDAHIQLAKIYFQRNQPDLAIEEVDKAIEIQPGQRKVEFMRAEFLLASKRFEEARDACDKLIEEDPEDPEARVMKARVLVVLKDENGAIEQLKSALIKHPDNIEAKLQLGRIYIQTGELDLAEQQAGEVILLDDKNVEGFLLQTQIAEKRGNLELAIHTVEKVVELKPSRVDSLFRLGMLYARKADDCRRDRDDEGFQDYCEKSLLMAKRITQANPRQKLLSQYVRGRVFLLQGKYNEAIVELQELAATGIKDPSLYIDLSRAQVAAGNPQMALQQLRSILAFDAENVQARLMMAAVYLQQKKFDSAIQTTQDILKDDPENVGARHLLTAAYLAGGRYENASEEMSEVARLSPDSPFGLISQSLLALSEGRYRDSGELAQKIIDQQPQEPTGYNLLGLSLMEQQDWQPAVTNFRKAIELNPDFMAPYQNLARLYVNIRRPDMAIVQLRAALEQQPDQVSFRLLLADLLIRLGTSNWDRALEEYNTVLTQQSDNIPALLGIARIHLGKSDYQKVEEISQKILDIESGQNQILLLLADSYIRQGLYGKALETFKDFSKLYPDQLPGHRGKAFCEVITGNSGVADRTLKAARNLIPGALELQLDYAVILQLEGEYDQAVSEMKQVIEKMDDPKHYDLIMANMFLSKGLQADALSKINRESNRLMGVDAAYRQFAEGVMKTKRNDWPARLNLALRFLRVGWTREAEITIRELSSEATDLSLVWSLQGQILLAQKNPEEAQQCYEKALALEPGYFGIHLYLADLARGLAKDLPLALQHHQALLKAAENPNDPFYLSTYVQIGRLYDLLGDPDQAIATYSRALRIDPNYFSALNNLAYLYSEQGKLDDALLFAEKARDISPYNGAVLDTLGWIYYLKDRPSEAMETMRIAAALLPFEPTVQFHLGKSLMANQKDDLALRAFRRSLLLSQDFPERSETEQLAAQLEQKLETNSTEKSKDSSSEG